MTTRRSIACNGQGFVDPARRTGLTIRLSLLDDKAGANERRYFLAVITFRVADAKASVSATDDVRQALYREAQLALRAAVGVRELDQFLADKDAIAREMEETIRRRVTALGLEIVSAGIRDVILPGDMKDLMNKVTEAKKAAEANLIVRREETAAMRSQANTAKLLEGNPTLMRLRELEVLEKVAASGKLNVVIGEKGLTERIVNLL